MIPLLGYEDTLKKMRNYIIFEIYFLDKDQVKALMVIDVENCFTKAF